MLTNTALAVGDISFASFAFEGIGNGYANTINAVALASTIISLTSGSTLTANYVPAQATLYVAAYDGTPNTGACRTETGENACLGNWYVPDTNEMALVYNALCAPGTPHGITTTQRYWTSTQASNQKTNVNATVVSAPCPITDFSDFGALNMSTTTLSTRFVRQF